MPRDRVFFLILGHVDPDQRLLIVKQQFSQCARAQLGFAHAGGAQEKETAQWAIRILQAGASASHRVGDGHDRFVLADHTRS